MISKIFVISNVLTSNVDAAGNFNIVSTCNYVKIFMGRIRSWSIPIQKVDFLKSTWTSPC